MPFFLRSKKVKKDSPTTQPRESRRAPPQCPPPPPPSQGSQSWAPGSPYQQPASFEPAGLLTPPPSYSSVAPSSTTYHQPGAYPPIIVNQNHYYLGAPPLHQAAPRSCTTSSSLGKVNLGSAVDLAKEICQGTCIPRLIDGALPLWHNCGGQLVNQGNAMVDEIYNRVNNVLTMIDQGGYDGKERDIYAWQPTQMPPQPPPPGAPMSEKRLPSPSRRSHRKEHHKGQTAAAAVAVSGSIFAKVDSYANSRLPMNLPPLKLYIPTYPLLCLAAQYSERVYEPPRGRAERDAHVEGGWLSGTKAMVIKSVPMDYMNTIVFAVRGTATFMDWAVNLNMEPTSPAGFLDDPDNLCHAGFLSVARKMVTPVARRLRQLLEEDPARASYSLLITGHSAGGAVAALLYSHMLATSRAAESDLNLVASCFKRIHCVTFGSPPISLFPLTKPDDYHRRPQLRKSLFFSFVNEGDPVTRADKAYVRSLLELFAAPTPKVDSHSESHSHSHARSHSHSRSYSHSRSHSRSHSSSRRRSEDGSRKSSRARDMSSTRASGRSDRPVWRVPQCTLSCAGRVVVLRSGDAQARVKGKATVEERLDEGVVAQIVTDEELRGVVWGDPVAHMMRLYAARIEVLAVGAVTGRGY